MSNEVDISENELLEAHPSVFQKLLFDHTTRKNIFWATDSYVDLGEGYQPHDEITIPKITGEHGLVLRPRAIKSREEQTKRSRDMAEVFTSSWTCNAQNNLVDDAWFGRKHVFNTEMTDAEGNHTWIPTEGKIVFPEGDKEKTWQKYVSSNVIEVTCGEGPYLVSRYDTVTGEPIPVKKRIGLLDRKLRIVSENTETTGDWLKQAQKAFMATYGFEWQGDPRIGEGRQAEQRGPENVGRVSQLLSDHLCQWLADEALRCQGDDVTAEACADRACRPRRF